MPKINSTYDVGAAFEAIEKELIASMIRNMKRHKVEEVAEDMEWTMWQTEQLHALERYRKENQKKFSKRFSNINAQIEALLQIANADGQMSQEAAILRAIKNGFPARRVGRGATAEFFRLNDRKLNALINATMNDMQRAEIAVLRMADDQYRKVIFNAQMYANTGAATYEKAVDMATKDFAAAGLNCVQYGNGARHTLADYADMAIRTAAKRAYLQGEGTKRQEWGIHTVIVNKRSDRGPGGVCPKCLPFVGKVFIDDVWSGGKKSDGPYPLISTAIEAGLYHPRCKDSHTTYFPGVSAPPDDSFTQKDLQEIEEAEKETAKQQNAELQAKKWQSVADTRLDPENRQAAQGRADRWEVEAHALRARANLSEDPLLRIDYMRRAEKAEEIGRNSDLRNRFKRARFRDGATREKYYEIDVDNWFPGSVPKSHEVVRLQEYTVDGVTYVVDGFAVVLKPSANEIRVAELLRDTIGGEIAIVPKVNKPEGVKTSDYMFHGIRYDLKTIGGGGASTLRDAVKRKKGQSKRFIMDITNSPLTDNDVEKQMHGMFGDKHTAFVEEIVIVRGDKIAKIYRRA